MTDWTRDDILELARTRAAERFARQDWESAERDYALLVRLDDTHADDWARLGVAALERGSTAFGAACLNRAYELDPSHAAAKLHLGEALIRLGQVAEGIELVMSIWAGRTDAPHEQQTPTVRRAAAVLAVARYAAEKSPAKATSGDRAVV
jgi:tetratricopeptide (TPR) repeat protein